MLAKIASYDVSMALTRDATVVYYVHEHHHDRYQFITCEIYPLLSLDMCPASVRLELASARYSETSSPF